MSHWWERLIESEIGEAAFVDAAGLDESEDEDEEAGEKEEPQVDWENIGAQQAGEEFASLLISLKQEGVLSAKVCCLLAFFFCRQSWSGGGD